MRPPPVLTSIGRSTALAAAVTAVCLASGCREPGTAAPGPRADAAPLTRRYVAGEHVRYVMTGVNQGRGPARRYTADCEGTVKQADDGSFFEETRWVRLVVDEKEVPLDAYSLGFRQHLSLDPRQSVPFPDIRGVHPMLIGPIFDLMTFYVDLHPTLHQDRLVRAGDHIYVPHGEPNSWADGMRVLVGQDSIDFDLTLVGASDRSAHLRVRHVPPPQVRIAFPADWMQARVGELPNNWVQVEKDASVSPPVFVAAVGQESFEVDVHIERPSGRIVSASMDNPVDVVQMRCRDEKLADCADRVSYRIHRRIELRPRP